MHRRVNHTVWKFLFFDGRLILCLQFLLAFHRVIYVAFLQRRNQFFEYWKGLVYTQLQDTLSIGLYQLSLFCHRHIPSFLPWTAKKANSNAFTTQYRAVQETKVAKPAFNQYRKCFLPNSRELFIISVPAWFAAWMWIF